MIRIAICDDDHTICTQVKNIILEFQKQNYKELTVKVELGMAYTQYYSGSFRQINSIDATWTGAAGSGLYEWDEYTLYTYPNSFPTAEAEAHTRGAVETVIDTSISGNLSIKNQLVNAGFDITLELGTKFYLRKIDNIDMYIR